MPISVMLVGGARPNFMKVAPLYHALRRNPRFTVTLVHTGQHYDDAMAGSFFRDLRLPDPDIELRVGSGSHAAQTARVLERCEEAIMACRPDVVIVVGDVNSTAACALAASKLQYEDGRRPRLAHVEAGLRSGDRSMPEEINRIVTDAICDFLFVTEPAGVENLRREGHPDARIFLVGNVMIDTLRSQATDARKQAAWSRFSLQPQEYAVATLHRPSNVDNTERLARLLEALGEASERLPVIFPVHPRTRKKVEGFGLDRYPRLLLCEPQPYVAFLSLLTGARVVLTDSGGVQEETTVLQVPCLTIRDNTERPITIEKGTNRLIGADPSAIVPAVDEVLSRPMPSNDAPPLWDGRAADRIVEALERALITGHAVAPSPSSALVG